MTGAKVSIFVVFCKKKNIKVFFCLKKFVVSKTFTKFAVSYVFKMRFFL